MRFSLAKEEARATNNAGGLPHGRHAARNVGVSIVRADRELDLDQNYVIQYDPRERWWGIEVDFPPALDDLFGVTNNKQSARTFADLARTDVESFLTNGVTLSDVQAQMWMDPARSPARPRPQNPNADQGTAPPPQGPDRRHPHRRHRSRQRRRPGRSSCRHRRRNHGHRPHARTAAGRPRRSKRR